MQIDINKYKKQSIYTNRRYYPTNNNNNTNNNFDTELEKICAFLCWYFTIFVVSNKILD